MKIAYVTTYDSSDVQNWSGSGFYIRKALEAQGNEILPIGSLNEPTIWPFFPKALYYKYIAKKNYHIRREPSVLKNLAWQVNNRLADQDYDIIFCPGTSPISYLKKQSPIVVWLDSTFATAIDFYPYYTNLAAETIRKANQTTQMALDKADLILFNSQWAADCTLKNYKVPSSKVSVVPFGANIDTNRDRTEIKRIISNRKRTCCELLFVGVEWERKGGDVAIQIAGELNRRGIPTKLHIVGVKSPRTLPDYCLEYDFISKASEHGKDLINSLFARSHFFILPSRAEMCAVVFAEAASFGLPVLTTNVGGIPTVIQNGKNGQMFELDANINSYADYIEEIFVSPNRYNAFAESSFEEYLERLNWDIAGKKVQKLIEGCVLPQVK